MASVENTGIGTGTKGSPQIGIEEQSYSIRVAENMNMNIMPPTYSPTRKHDPGGIGSKNPIKTQHEGQMLLESGYKEGKQVYNITDEGQIVKFQPDNTTGNGYHAYQVASPRDIPNSVLRQMLNDGRINSADYNKLRKGKKK